MALLLSRTASAKGRGLFNGLRVRMGVATGEMTSESGFSRITDKAKGERRDVGGGGWGLEPGRGCAGRDLGVWEVLARSGV
jgi:hypothetical protein